MHNCNASVQTRWFSHTTFKPSLANALIVTGTTLTQLMKETSE